MLPARTVLPLEEYRTRFPRIKFFGGKSYHFDGYEWGVMWARTPYPEVTDGEHIYRRSLSLQYSPMALRALRNVLRIRW